MPMQPQFRLASVLLLLLLGASTDAQLRVRRYEVQPFALPAGHGVRAINDAGVVVTNATGGGVVVVPGQPPIDVAAAVGLDPSDTWILEDVSNTGVVLGQFELPSGRWDAFRYTIASAEVEVLEGLGSSSSVPMCLADSGAFSSRERQEPISVFVPFQNVIVLADNNILPHSLGTAGVSTVLPGGTVSATAADSFLFRSNIDSSDVVLFGPTGLINLGQPPMPGGASSLARVDTNSGSDTLVFWTVGSNRQYWVNRAGQWESPAAQFLWSSIDDRGRLYGQQVTPGVATENPAMLEVDGELVRLETLLADPLVETVGVGSISDSGTVYSPGRYAGADANLLLTEGAPCLILEFGGGLEQGNLGPNIDINADPGDPIPFLIRGGLAGDPVGLFYRIGSSFVASPFFLNVFDADGEAGVTVTVPSSAVGLSIDFLALALDSELGVLDSVVRTVNI